VGHRAVSQLVDGSREDAHPIQAKLTVGPAGDAYEQEADRVAGQIMRMPEPGAAAAEGAAAGGPPPVQRAAAPGNALQFTRADASAGFEARAEVEASPAANNGGGSPLPKSARSFMEPRFGANFGGVRVHTGPPGDGNGLVLDLSELPEPEESDPGFKMLENEQ
jgi:Domain of unknown function (DUF4157)